MNIRTSIQRWWMGADLYDHAVLTIQGLDAVDRTGEAKAHAFIRKVHAEHPNPDRTCSVPNCCQGSL